jgi:hypothetical protein
MSCAPLGPRVSLGQEPCHISAIFAGLIVHHHPLRQRLPNHYLPLLQQPQLRAQPPNHPVIAVSWAANGNESRLAIALGICVEPTANSAVVAHGKTIPAKRAYRTPPSPLFPLPQPLPLLMSPSLTRRYEHIHPQCSNQSPYLHLQILLHLPIPLCQPHDMQSKYLLSLPSSKQHYSVPMLTGGRSKRRYDIMSPSQEIL